jgi:hypothetical protein
MERTLQQMKCPAWLILTLLAATATGGAEREKTVDCMADIVVYGGTSAGVVAAVQAVRMGKSVVLVCPEKHLGGLTSGGLGWTDSGRKEVIGGIAREFYQSVKEHYDRPESWAYEKPEDCRKYRPEDDAMWVFEPHLAEEIFERLIAEHDVPVHRDEWLDRENGVSRNGARIAAITTLSGATYEGKAFVDATYEGDLMAAAGVSYHVGREPNSQYGETLNGVQKDRNVKKHRFREPVSPYVRPDDPTSGLVPRVHGEHPGEEGEGDRRLQAYCYRMCMTDEPENRVPFPKPSDYDETQYELLFRHFEAGDMMLPLKIDMMVNRKTDTNNQGAFSTDNIGMNYDYPEATYARRREILEEHQTYQKGLMWTLANHPRTPGEIRRKMAPWGLAKDEFTDNGNWPHQIYVREGRRMVSDFVMTERHLRGELPTPRPAGMGSYNMDSHNAQRYIARDADGRPCVQNEGDVQVKPGRAYPISYGAIVPKASECGNLLAPVCVSSSHIAYGSIRMEPVFMILGQSAATAAAHAIDEQCAAQDVDYERLRKRLLEDGQRL